MPKGFSVVTLPNLNSLETPDIKILLGLNIHRIELKCIKPVSHFSTFALMSIDGLFH